MMYNTRQELADAVIKEYNRTVKGQAEQLYCCKAWIFMPDNSDFLILQSYSTIVAAFQRTTGILWVFGFYSNTTVQHIAKFQNWIRYKYLTGWNYPKKLICTMILEPASAPLKRILMMILQALLPRH